MPSGWPAASEHVVDDWEEMDGDTFRIAGLLYMVNKAVLWPLGIALRLTWIDEGASTLDVVMLRQPEVIVEGKIDETKEPGGCHPARRFAEFASDRLRNMPTEMEREMALKALRRVMPGLDVSPVRTSE